MNTNRLLFVDDEIEICKIIQNIATECQFDAITVTSADEFRQAYKGLDPTLVMIDLHLIGEDGIQLLRFLSLQLCQCPIVLISGYDDKILTTAMLLGQSYGLSIIETLHKPIKVASFMEVMNNNKVPELIINETTITDAIANHEFIVYYQPQISLPQKKLIGVEALIRWQPKDKPMIYPDQFIPIAERNHLIKLLTHFVLNESLRQTSLWAKSGIPLFISINISANHLDDLELPEYFEEVVKKYGIEPKMVYFEITETAVSNKPKITMDILARLRLKGFNLSMDDFGTGYSSMLALHRMPFNQIKIDKSFVSRIDKDQQLQLITTALLALFKSLKIETVAEGIETKKVLQIFQESSCDIVQGYYLGRPLPVTGFEDWITKNLSDDLCYLPMIMEPFISAKNNSDTAP